MTLALPRAWRVPMLLAALALVIDLLANLAEDRWQAAIDEAQLTARHQRAARRLQPAEAATSASTLANWPATWPAAEARDVQVSTLLSDARRLGLQVARADLSAAPAATPGLISWHVRLTAQGPYASHRAWIQAALASHPSLELDRLRLSRANADAAEVGLDIEWTLHTRVTGTAR